MVSSRWPIGPGDKARLLLAARRKDGLNCRSAARVPGSRLRVRASRPRVSVLYTDPGRRATGAHLND